MWTENNNEHGKNGKKWTVDKTIKYRTNLSIDFIIKLMRFTI